MTPLTGVECLQCVCYHPINHSAIFFFFLLKHSLHPSIAGIRRENKRSISRMVCQNEWLNQRLLQCLKSLLTVIVPNEFGFFFRQTSQRGSDWCKVGNKMPVIGLSLQEAPHILNSARCRPILYCSCLHGDRLNSFSRHIMSKEGHSVTHKVTIGGACLLLCERLFQYQYLQMRTPAYS